MKELRGELAGFVGTKLDNLALTHNATHAMYLVAGGLELEPGDEVLMTNQEHPTCRGTWSQESARRGIRVREVQIPVMAADPKEIVDAFLREFTDRTRVLVFSDLLTTTGSRTPVRALCKAARERGILSVVDGAHCPGQVPLDIDALGCDAYCGSPHKWLLSPAGTGFLVLRDELMESLWCANGGHWWDKRDLKAARFMGLGTNNDAVLAGLGAALQWYRDLGPERIYARQHSLARSVLERAGTLPGVDLQTPDDDSRFFAMVTFGAAGLDVEAC